MKHILLLSISALLSITAQAQNRYYVHATATGANNGASWTDAFTDLQSALQTAIAGDEVWVAEGVYYPTATTDRHLSFEPKSGLRLYGGFEGNEITLDQRNWTNHVAMLSGDIGTPGDSTDNSLNVMYLFQPDTNTVVDGFTLCYGRADDEPSSSSSRDRFVCGGGMYIEAGNWDALANIQNCRFWRNSALSFGGGVMINGASMAGVAPRFIDCRFEENHAEINGGGMARFGGSWKERGHELDACVFTNNRASFRGGGLFYNDSNGPNKVSFSACLFEQNRAVTSGGAMHLVTGKNGLSSLTIQQCEFKANFSLDAAAIKLFTNGNDLNGEVVIDGCQFIDHISLPGAEITNLINTDQISSLPSSITLKNCQIKHNYNIGLYNAILLSWVFAELNLENSIFEENIFGGMFFPSSFISSSINKSVFRSNECAEICGFSLIGNVAIGGVSNSVFENNKTTSSSGIIFSDNIEMFIITNCAFLYERRPVINSLTDKLISIGGASLLINNTIFTDSLSKYSLSSDNTVITNNSFGFFDCNDQFPSLTCGPGNLSGLDPMFRDTAAGDYTLLPCSPLINAGNNAAAAGLLTDLAGNPRILEGIVDIGPYEAPAFAQAAEPLVKPACSGASNGSIIISPAYGCEPYTYQWEPSAGNGPELNGLPPGPYRLTITDGSGRQIRDTVLVETAPVPELSLTATHVQCGETEGGALNANVSNGTPPYQYQWLPAATDTAFLSHLGPGQYALTLTDVNGCMDSSSAQIGLQGMITLLVNGQAIPCYGGTGWLSATPVTGAAPFSWQWQGWNGTDSLAQPLSPGNYAVTVSDVYGCTASFAFPPFTQPDSLWAITAAIDQTQNNPPNGEVTVVAVLGGKSPFDFLWSTGSTQQSIATLSAGMYTVTITDKNGCTAEYKVTVEWMVSTGSPGAEANALLLYPNPATDWMVVVLPPAEHSWRLELSNAAGSLVWSDQTNTTEHRIDLENLASGVYTLAVRASDGKLRYVKEMVISR